MRAAAALPFILVCLLRASRLQASLKWEETVRSSVADPAKSEFATDFAFRNDGKAPIKILDIATSCGCTAAKLDKRDYAPGESGKIGVVVHYGSDANESDQLVTVITDEPQNNQHALAINITIPGRRRQFERITVSPQAVDWPRGAKPVAKVIRLHVERAEDAIQPVAASDENKAFELKLRQPDPADHRLYELTVIPLRVDRAVQSTITIATNSRSFRPSWLPEITYQIIAAVK